MKAKLSHREIWCLNWNFHFFGLDFAILNTEQVKITTLHFVVNNMHACCRPQKKCNNVCLSSLHCLTIASSNFLLGEMQIGTGYIILSFLRCEFSNVSSKHSDHNRHNGIGCIDLTFLHYVSSKEISNFLNEQRKTLLCIFKWFLKLTAPKDAWSHWLHLMTFSTVGFRMYPYIGWPSRCKVTVVAFIWLFSTVRFQMYPQIACMRIGIVT